MFANALKIKTELSHLQKYSDPLFITLLKHSLKSSWVWRYKLGTPGFGEFLPFFSADPLNLCQVGWERSCTAIFRSLERCSIGLKSRLWLRRSRSFRDLSWSHSCVVLAVCLGSLSCWKVKLLPSREVLSALEQVFIKNLSVLCSLHLSLDPD